MWLSRKKYNYITNMSNFYEQELAIAESEITDYLERLDALQKENEALFWKLHKALKRNEITKDKKGVYRDPSGKFASPKQKEMRLTVEVKGAGGPKSGNGGSII